MDVETTRIYSNQRILRAQCCRWVPGARRLMSENRVRGLGLCSAEFVFKTQPERNSRPYRLAESYELPISIPAINTSTPPTTT